MPRATPILREKVIDEQGNILELVIWRVPTTPASPSGVRYRLALVRRACEGDANIMEAVLEAARRDVTLGEICQVFRDVFGEYRDPGHV